MASMMYNISWRTIMHNPSAASINHGVFYFSLAIPDYTSGLEDSIELKALTVSVRITVALWRNGISYASKEKSYE